MDLEQKKALDELGVTAQTKWVDALDLLIPKFVELPNPEIQLPILKAVLCCNSATASKLPALAFIGQTNSGKSNCSKFIADLFGSAPPSDSTLPAIKRHLNKTMVRRDREGKVMLTPDGRTVLNHRVFCLEEVHPSHLGTQTNLYKFFKISRDKATAKMTQASISSDDEDAEKTYDVFCLFTITSIHPFYAKEELSEMDRRTLWFNCKESERCDFLSSQNYDFYPLLEKFYSEWEVVKTQYREFLFKPRPKKIKSLYWDKTRESLYAGVVLGLWTREEGIEAFHNYHEWRNEEFGIKKDDALYDYLKSYLESKNSISAELLMAKIQTLIKLGALRITKFNNSDLHDAMERLGFKLVEGSSVPATDFFSEHAIYWQRKNQD